MRAHRSRCWLGLVATSIAIVALPLLVTSPATAATYAGDHDWVLRTGSELTSTDVVQSAKREALVYLRTSYAAPESPGRVRNLQELPHYVDELALAMCQQAAAMDPYHPRFYLSDSLGWRFGADNPDTVYQATALAPDARYVITGRRGTSAFTALQLLNGYYADERSGSDQTPDSIALLDGKDLDVAEDGTFTVTLDSTPAAGRTNHVQLPHDATQLVLTVRDTLSDWEQTSTELTIERVSPDRVPLPPTSDQLARQCAEWVVTMAEFADLEWASRARQLPPNVLSPVMPTQGGLPGQRTSGGRFDLAADEALIVTVPPIEADYSGFMLTNDWFTSINYADHTSSLAAGQAEPNMDGSYTYVISANDPGVSNWLDTGGHGTGALILRWQGVSAVAPDYLTPVVLKVKSDLLPTVLPPGMQEVDPTEREVQLAQRRKAIRERLAHLPPRLLPFDPQTFTYWSGEPLI
jgi:hypothetical protein